jgi:hypothetical protein
MKKAESQRIYWQQYAGSNSSSHNTTAGQYSRRELITSSAAIRISPDAAKAKDVTKLLRDTLNLSSLNTASSTSASTEDGTININNDTNNDNDTNDPPPQDSLVLVGTLYSLPRDYVQFEHEPTPKTVEENTTTTTTTIPSSTTSITSSVDPFHVVKTLQANDNPLQIRDQMMEHLRRIQDQTTILINATAAKAPLSSASASVPTIAPKVQWYFVPNHADPIKSPIPSCIDLDGYCTGMEDDDDKDEQDDAAEEESDEELHYGGGDETDTPDDLRYDDPDLILSRCPFLKNPVDDDHQKISSPSSPSSSSSLPGTTDCQMQKSLEQRRHAQHTKELRRYTQLRSSSHATTTPSVSGYLLKQSSVDPHVWRRVHCVLTDDHLWYVTRIPYDNNTTTATTFPRRVAQRHGRISLVRALLLEPNTECTASPLFRIPHSFQVVSSRGTSHIFRAPHHSLQQQRHWIQALSTKISERFENSLLDHAALIVADESIARNRRRTSVAVTPLVAACGGAAACSAGTSTTITTTTPPTNCNRVVLRLGMDIAEYREQCRHVQALLPAKQPVVVRSPRNSQLLAATTTTTTTTKEQQEQMRMMMMQDSIALSPEPLDPETQRKVQETWDLAAGLLGQAAQVAMDVGVSPSSSATAALTSSTSTKNHLLSTRSLETLCRHVDYVITGTHRPLSSSQGTLPKAKNNGGVGGVRGGNTNDYDPPPMDLFDLLLAELQSMVVVASKQQQQPKEDHHHTS